ncbi:helix-turn-helix transcriptional regulator [Candidatus Woesearchaeota archaeon]|nr:helix-turn-helix transcriptional regulator [Candidatus Woesearchaeota archaeon]
MRITRFTIIREGGQPKNNINDLLLLFGERLGLFTLRDKDKSCYRIFITLVRALKRGVKLSSDELAIQTGLTRGTVVHHLNRLTSAGIIVAEANKYYIPHNSLEDLVEDMRGQVDIMFDNLLTTAKEIDKTLDFKHN